ncbi:MAG: hypothetical protein DHS20C21_24150 [Gemmatimonadota bacterium]|nr:MAG: hypothetical protein DHS20C21_24150 [Gemmatimonadota bacterium]
MNDTKGFTLIEMLIVIAVISVIATIAIPNLLSARLSANETAAIATLRSISSAQMQFRGLAYNDNDADGQGEYGYLAEMSGLTPPRINGAPAADPINPPTLSGAFRNVQDSGLGTGVVTRTGFVYQLYLPGAGGAPVPEDVAGGPGAGVVDDDLAEVIWCCYAWPATKDTTGTRAFVVNQAGDILMTDNVLQQYSGPDGGPDGLAAYSGADMRERLSINALPAPAQDAAVWRPAN